MDNCDGFLHSLKIGIEDLRHSQCYGRYADKFKPLAASSEAIEVEMTVDEADVNGKGTLHGGQAAVIVDLVTALAVGLTVRDTPLVSTEMSVSYMRPVPLGEQMIIEGRCLKIGMNIIFAEATFRRKSDGALLAKGKHTIARLNHLKKQNGETVRQ
ncbi:Protein F42H10.6 [Aphelenchoides avenae]|nr:Protein F42H10.6 [Aphelenchus avenae]